MASFLLYWYLGDRRRSLQSDRLRCLGKIFIAVVLTSSLAGCSSNLGTTTDSVTNGLSQAEDDFLQSLRGGFTPFNIKP